MKDLMDERDRDRAFADRRGDPLDVAPSYVTDRKHSRSARFEKVRRARERPARGGEIRFR